MILSQRFRSVVFPLISLCFFASFAYAQKPMVVAYGYNYKPFAWEEQGEMKGIQVDIIREVLEKRLNIPVLHQGYPWTRAQRLVQQGEADALFTAPTPERLRFTTAGQEALIPVRNILFTYRHHPRLEELRQIKSFSDLKGFHVVDYIGGGWSKSYMPGVEVYRVPEINLALDFLAKKRADAFVQSELVVRCNIQQLALQDAIIALPVVLGTADHYLLIRPSSPYVDLLPRVDRIIREMKADGSLEALFAGYDCRS